MDAHRLATYDDLRVGQRASFSKTVTEADIAHFVAICGDVNPLHVDADFARRTFFGGRIAHGLLTASLLSTVIGTLLPGTGAVYRSQTLKFLRPVRLGDTLTASLELVSVDREREELVLTGEIVNQNGQRVLEGRSVLSLLRGLETEG